MRRRPRRGRRRPVSVRSASPSCCRPALGGIVIGHEVGRALGVRAIFAERQDGRLPLRRGFTLEPSDRVLVVEDVRHHGRVDAGDHGRGARGGRDRRRGRRRSWIAAAPTPNSACRFTRCCRWRCRRISRTRARSARRGCRS